MPPLPSVEDQVVDYYQALYETLFHAPFADEIRARIQRNAVRRQVESAADAASRALTRFFTLQQIDEAAVAGMLAAIAPLDRRLTLEALANPNVSPESLVETLLPHLPCPEPLLPLAPAYRIALHGVVQGLTLMGPVMSEWRASGFGSTFEIPRRVTARLNEISDRINALAGLGGGEADERYELTYRDYLCQRFHRVEAGTVRMTTNQSVDLRELFVMPRLERRPLADSPEGAMAELMDLSAARELATRRARFTPPSENEEEEEPRGSPALETLTPLVRAVLVGAPGSGKSTLFEWLQLQVAAAELPWVMEDSQQAIPLLLRVRQLKLDQLPEGRTLIAAATASEDQAGVMPEGWIERQLEQGRILLLLDGLDEVEPERRDDTLLPWLTALIERFPRCRYLLSSRPSGYPPGALKSAEFDELDLLDFGRDEVGAYTRHWCTAVRLAQNEAEKEARRKGTEEGEVILNSFSDHDYIRDLARNPLMLSAICLVNYFEKGKLPDDRAKLYALCVEGLLHHWDQRRGIHSEFGLEEKLRVCREIAIAMQRDDRAEYEAEKVREIFSSALNDEIRSASLLTHIRNRSGLLVERRSNVFAFSHLTFQEYLAAASIYEGNSIEIDIEKLIPEANDSRWIEVINLYCGLASVGHAKFAIESILHSKLNRRGTIAGEAYLTKSNELKEDKSLREDIINRICIEPDYPILHRFQPSEVELIANNRVGIRSIEGSYTFTNSEIFLIRRPHLIRAQKIIDKINEIARLSPIGIECLIAVAIVSNNDQILHEIRSNKLLLNHFLYNSYFSAFTPFDTPSILAISIFIMTLSSDIKHSRPIDDIKTFALSESTKYITKNNPTITFRVANGVVSRLLFSADHLPYPDDPNTRSIFVKHFSAFIEALKRCNTENKKNERMEKKKFIGEADVWIEHLKKSIQKQPYQLPAF
ncbi:NACHT domain-containing protein [Endothiovibrio diazotrophicus]